MIFVDDKTSRACQSWSRAGVGKIISDDIVMGRHKGLNSSCPLKTNWRAHVCLCFEDEFWGFLTPDRASVLAGLLIQIDNVLLM